VIDYGKTLHQSPQIQTKVRNFSISTTHAVIIFITCCTCFLEGKISFWTSGLYSPQKSQWIWYSQNWTPAVVMSQNTYQNWAGNAVPRPSNNIEICLVFTVDVLQKTTTWQQKSCISPYNYYICELPKTCY
jgi:hypothetical protein